MNRLKSGSYGLPLFALLITLVLLITLFLGGCQSKDPMATAKIYMEGWAGLDYAKMYETLSSETMETFPKDTFIERYEKIFSAIGLNSIDLKPEELIKDGDKAYLPITAQLHTDTLNTFDARFSLPLVLEDSDWKVNWGPSLIFPDLGPGEQVRLIDEHALRGNICHRDGEPIAIEGEAYTLGGVPGKIPDKDEFAKALAPLLEIKEETILKELSKDWVKEDTFVPLRNLPLSIDADFKEKLLSVKGTMLVTNIVTDSRRYLDNELYAHVVGYVQRAGQEDLEKKEGYREGDLIGKQGIEASMEEYLHGTSGYTLLIRDEEGNDKSIIAEIPPKDGDNITLTLDPKLQTIAKKALKGHRGTVVILNPKTGEVLAMVSYPDFNPNVFPNGVLPSTWKSLSDDPDKPFINRGTYSLFPPGSTLKPFTGAMALEEGVINSNTTVKVAEKRSWTPDLGDWNAPPITRTKHPEGPVNLDRALVWSDNIYFAWAALQLPYETMENYFQRFTIGEPLTFDIPVSKSSLKGDNTKWSKRLLAVSGIGQGEVLATPLQIASMYTAFMNHGDILQPQIIKNITSAQGEVIRDFEPKVWAQGALTEASVNTILPSLINVVEDKAGTARSIKMDDITIAAKTGTAERDDEGKNEIGWLVAFTPEAENPIVMAVTLEVPAGEGRAKFDIAREILEGYYLDDPSQ